MDSTKKTYAKPFQYMESNHTNYLGKEYGYTNLNV